jgi:hypothetical protein
VTAVWAWLVRLWGRVWGRFTVEEEPVAFPTTPTVAAGQVLTGVQANTTATRTFPNLSGLTSPAGDLIIAICIGYNTSTGTDAAFSGWTGGFTEFHDSATNGTQPIGMAYKWSTGAETGTFAVTQAGTITGHACFILMSIPGAHATTPPEAGSRASGTTAVADPAAFNPAGWAVDDTLWIAVCGSGEVSTTGSYTGTVATPPTNYSGIVETAASGDVAGAVQGAVAFRQATTGSEDVAGFVGVDVSNARNSAVVIAVRPSAEAAQPVYMAATSRYVQKIQLVGPFSSVIRVFTPTGPAVVEGTATGTLTFTGTAVAQPPFITAIAGTGTASHFVDQSGQPILLRAYSSWMLFPNAGRWSGTWQDNLDDAIAGLVTLGCNVLMTKPFGHTSMNGVNDDGRTPDGVLPFVGGDIGVLNDTFWQRVDYLLNSAAAAGITVFLNIAHATTDFAGGVLAGQSAAAMGDYGTALGNRYKDFPNVMWKYGGDYFDVYNTELTALTTGLRAAGDTHLLTVENFSETTSRRRLDTNVALNTGIDNADFNLIYSYNVTYDGINHAFLETSPIPAIWGDGYYAQDSIGGNRKLFRDLVWWALSSGARGTMYGSEATWRWDSGAAAALTSETFPSADQPGIWDAFVALVGWHLLVPDTDNSFLTAGRGTHAASYAAGGSPGDQYNYNDPQDGYVTAAVTADGKLAVVYFPIDTTVTVDDTELVANYEVFWLDPVSGATTAETIAGTYSPTGTNSLGGADRVLVFRELGGVTGTASGTFGFTGTASGHPTTQGTAAGSVAFTGTAVGVDRAVGQAAGSFAFTGTAAGVPDVQGQAAGAVTFTGTASGFVGTPPVQGVASGAFTFTGAAAGVPETFGTATASVTFTGTAAGNPRKVGTAAASLTFTGHAAGTVQGVVQGQAAASLTFTGAATGTRETFGQATASLTFTGSATGFAGTPPVQGQAAGAFTFTGTASGKPVALGQGAGSLTFTGTALGDVDRFGQATGAVTFTGTVAGFRSTTGQASGAMVFLGTVIGLGTPPMVDRPPSGFVDRPPSGLVAR